MIISASRRTDIPAYYSKWFINRIKDGYAMIPNPRNPNRLARVELSSDKVDCIVFWTKNPLPMFDKLPFLNEMGYQYYFEFSVTAFEQDVENNLPLKKKAIETFKQLSARIGAKRVDWRFDPIMVNKQFTVDWHIQRFSELCQALRPYTERCIISFINTYSHTGSMIKGMNMTDILKTAEGISKVAREYDLPIFTCAEEFDLIEFGIEHASCIDQRKVEQIIGSKITAKKDLGQRKACGCIESVDVGVYDTCANGCSYCYATTSMKTVQQRMLAHDPNSPILTGIPRGDQHITDRTKATQRIMQLSLFE